MKVEKINENKIKITLTFEELERRQISLTDLETNNSVAKNLFIDLIEESNLDEDFIIDDAQLFIEACYDNNDLFIVTITKVDNFPELRKYALIESAQKKGYKRKDTTKRIINYTVESNIYSFTSLNTLLKLSEILRKEKLFCGRNSLYKYKNIYFLIFNETSVKNPRFLKTFSILSEYCERYYAYEIYKVSIKEKSKLIIKDNALQKLSKI